MRIKKEEIDAILKKNFKSIIRENWNTWWVVPAMRSANIWRTKVNLTSPGFGLVIAKYSSNFHEFLFLRMGIQHGSAQAVFAMLSLKYFKVDATFAAFPEFRILSDLIKGDRIKSETGIHFHDRQTGCDAE
jgi:hypothetical protein